jgi:hypothetical protein
MTDLERAQLRLKCAEPFVSVASKHGLEKDQIFGYAEKMWEFVIKNSETPSKKASQ